MSALARNNPLADAVFLRRPPHAPASTAYNQVSRSVVWISEHALDDRAVYRSVCGDIPCLAFGQGPRDGAPGAVLLEVHPPEGKIFHDVPAYDARAVGAVVELKNVVDAAFGCGVVEVLVESSVGVRAVVFAEVFGVDPVSSRAVRGGTVGCTVGIVGMMRF